MRKLVREAGIFPDEKARYLRRFLSRKAEIPEESFIFGHGSSHILSLYLQTFKPEAVSLLEPFCGPKAVLLRNHGIKYDPIPLINTENSFRIDADKVLSHASAGKTVLLMNPHDPSGATLSENLINDLLQAATRSQGMLIIDEAFIEYGGLQSAACQAAGSSCCLVVKSLSLFHALAGLRIGYGVGHPSLVARLAANLTSGAVSSMALAAALASVRDKAYHRRTAEYIAGEKAYVLDKLKALPGLTLRDTPCNFILVGLEKGGRDITAMLLGRTILVDSFEDEAGRTWIRVPMRRRPQNARFTKTLRYLLSLPEAP